MFTWEEVYEVRLRKGKSTRCDVVRKSDETVVAPNLKNKTVATELAQRLADEDRKAIESMLLGVDND